MKSFLVMKYNIGNEGRRRIESLEEREGNETVKAMAENARERNRNGKWKRKSFVIAGKSSLFRGRFTTFFLFTQRSRRNDAPTFGAPLTVDQRVRGQGRSSAGLW